jgi:hypothetical protein
MKAEDLSALLAEIQQVNNRLDSITAILDEGGTVTRQTISHILVGVPYRLGRTVTHRVPTDNPDQLLLLLIMEEDSEVGWHDHDCPELGTVLWGSIRSGEAVYGPLQQYRFAAGQGHAVRALAETGILLEFPPPC